MDKIKINETLKYLAQIIKENPSIDIDDVNWERKN